ncbi:hypothetical protein BC936DRAFT_143464 [Jimgerdemannia flammicorona]|uniref:Uncharacterized protein n=1 Tax=Jimgerdemannia flammicorona TaxID=994334 RepID=A0A433DDX1_9FUNG|nr:hypothetical protein BC936DRAFT_143464 [Jimgerdemannia flammicorona]
MLYTSAAQPYPATRIKEKKEKSTNHSLWKIHSTDLGLVALSQRVNKRALEGAITSMWTAETLAELRRSERYSKREDLKTDIIGRRVLGNELLRQSKGRDAKLEGMTKRGVTAADNTSVASASEDGYRLSFEDENVLDEFEEGNADEPEEGNVDEPEEGNVNEPEEGNTDGLKENGLNGFMETYRQMSNGKKWKMSSGTIVENILFENCKSDKDELLAHSWIIDLDNTETEAMFDAKDWQEITDAMRPPPKVDKICYMQVTTTSELRKTLAKISYIGEDAEYDRRLRMGRYCIAHNLYLDDKHVSNDPFPDHRQAHPVG